MYVPPSPLILLKQRAPLARLAWCLHRSTKKTKASGQNLVFSPNPPHQKASTLHPTILIPPQNPKINFTPVGRMKYSKELECMAQSLPRCGKKWVSGIITETAAAHH
ncbi:unnamed protein product [Ectocarpus sp. 12 AP-2014]